MSAWKRFEDSCAAALGGRRKLGNRGGNTSDGDENVPFAMECKLGYERYAIHKKWLEQAIGNGKREGKPWILVQRPKRARMTLVTTDLLTFTELVERAGLLEEAA